MKKEQEAAPESQDFSDSLLNLARKLNFLTLILVAAALGAMVVESRQKKDRPADGERLTLIIGKMHKADENPQKEA